MGCAKSVAFALVAAGIAVFMMSITACVILISSSSNSTQSQAGAVVGAFSGFTVIIVFVSGVSSSLLFMAAGFMLDAIVSIYALAKTQTNLLNQQAKNLDHISSWIQWSISQSTNKELSKGNFD